MHLENREGGENHDFGTEQKGSCAHRRLDPGGPGSGRGPLPVLLRPLWRWQQVRFDRTEAGLTRTLLSRQ